MLYHSKLFLKKNMLANCQNVEVSFKTKTMSMMTLKVGTHIKIDRNAIESWVDLSSYPIEYSLRYP